MVKYGTTRTVVLVGCWAIKVPTMVEWRLFLLGLLANMQEAKFWTTRHRKLCPVLFAMPGGFFVIMRRAAPLPRHVWDTLDVAAWRDCDDWAVPVEDKWDSFGVVDGRIVAVDYGN